MQFDASVMTYKIYQMFEFKAWIAPNIDIDNVFEYRQRITNNLNIV